MGSLRVMAVGAHPDDLEILCGGTLAKYAGLGHEVTMAHVLNGDKGHYKLRREELARIRKQEAEEAARTIGAEILSLDLPDAELFANLENRKLVIDLIREARPDLIITHAPGDYCSDHTVTSQLVCEASFYSAAPLLETSRAAHDKIPPVFFMDTVAGMGFLPTEYVDISGAFQKKMDMLRRHASQLEWLKDHDNIDILEFVETTARFRGLQCGVQYAEAFRQYAVWGRQAPTRLLP